MKALLAVLALALAACEAPPVWTPGSATLKVWAPNDDIWEAIDFACREWWHEPTGLTCERVWIRSTADVSAFKGKCDDPTFTACASGYTKFGSTKWYYEIAVHDEFWGEAHRGLVMVHEIGHLLGMWEHLDEGPAIMTADVSSDALTTADLDYLESVWGEAPWTE